MRLKLTNTKPILFLFCIKAAGAFLFQVSAEAVESNRKKLGGDFRIIIYTENVTEARERMEEAYHLVDSLNMIFSSYTSDSEISQLNHFKVLNRPSEALAAMLDKSQEAFEKSNGYFDVTIQPAIDMWKLAGQNNRLPGNREIEALRKKATGFDHALVRFDSHTVQIKKKAEINFGGIAKGYIVDKVYDFLTQLNCTAYLVEAAGDIRVFGTPPGEESWVLGISSHDKPMYRVKLQSGQAIATSGMTYRYFTIDRRRYSHIINPKTLLPVTHNYTSTVIAGDATTADFLASTLNIVVDSIEIEAIVRKNTPVEYMVFSNDQVIRKSRAFPMVHNITDSINKH
ncbi:FAD:protein FMN transferase [Fulvivirga sp. M361]|uniref:FAD:protein FMN transferase n=1 Tax=Fulvivirga sp. M361 TaxID=2594266 RepID=UPI00117ABC87|nr:FAD:protein FMN transferase [Fulvivirga sp. M361]TRX58441.1 FAD:protein FMN transferase [Fulvivirga sp. M361]